MAPLRWRPARGLEVMRLHVVQRSIVLAAAAAAPLVLAGTASVSANDEALTLADRFAAPSAD
ncbi:MAG: hypothetical protein AAFO62_09410, partial [Pseudomonadota bacterium]